MAQLLAALYEQWPIILLIVAGFYLLHHKIDGEAKLNNIRFKNLDIRFDDLKENFNTRFDDVNNRIDDLRDDYKALNNKVDTLSAQIYRIEGALNLPRTGTED